MTRNRSLAWGLADHLSARGDRRGGGGTAGRTGAGGRPGGRSAALPLAALARAMVATWVMTAALPGAAADRLQVTVAVDEVATTHGDFGHAMYALWNHGSTSIVRLGDTVVASGIARLPDREPLNNVVCLLGTRKGGGAWQWAPMDVSGPTREPCPLGLIAGEDKVVVTTSRVTDFDTRFYAAVEPAVVTYRLDEGRAERDATVEPWSPRDDVGLFWDHSRRSVAVDPDAARVFMMVNAGPSHSHAEWMVHDFDKGSTVKGKVEWPKLKLPKGQAAVLAYAQSALRGQGGHLFAVLDVPEPVKAWNTFKTRGDPKAWDYVFRRLYYSWTPRISAEPFGDWVEVANVEGTAGEIRAGDLSVEADGTVHLVWTEYQTWPPALKDTFFPDLEQVYRLQYAKISKGEVVSRRTLLASRENDKGNVGAPTTARFHRLADGRLVVIYSLLARPPRWATTNSLMVLGEDGAPGQIIDLALSRPMISFFTASERAGSSPSDSIDLFGIEDWSSKEVRYVRLDLKRR